MKIALPLGTLLLLFAGSVAVGAPDKLSVARDLMADGRYFAASEILIPLTEKKESAEAFRALAECEMKLGDLDAATNAALSSLDIEEDAAEGWKLLGRIATKRGEQALTSRAASNTIKSWYAEAEMKLREALKRSSDDPDLLWRLGVAKEFQEYPDRAEKYYRQQIEKYPTNPRGYCRLGAQLSNRASGTTPQANELRKQAIEIFDQGLEKAGPDAETLYYKGIALEWLGKRSEAKECYLKAIRTDPGYEQPWDRLAKIGFNSRQFLDLAKEILEKDETDPVAAAWAAGQFKSSGTPEQVIDVVMPAFERHRENYKLWWWASWAAGTLLRSNPQRAIEVFKKIDRLDPFYGDAANNIGLYHRDVTKNYAESLKWYLRSVEKEPDNQDLLNDTALIYLFNTNQQKKALPLFQHVLELVTDEGQAPQRGYWDTLENLCKYYWEVEHDPEKVIEYARMRYETTNGVEPYNMSPVARQWAEKAKKELGR